MKFVQREKRKFSLTTFSNLGSYELVFLLTFLQFESRLTNGLTTVICSCQSLIKLFGYITQSDRVLLKSAVVNDFSYPISPQFKMWHVPPTLDWNSDVLRFLEVGWTIYYYRGSPDGTNFAPSGNRTIAKIVLSEN